MNLIQTLGIGLSLAFLLNCCAAIGAQTLPIRSLKKGAFSGIREAKQEVVKTADVWEKLWKQHATAAGDSEKIPAVDFSRLDEVDVIVQQPPPPAEGVADGATP